MIQDEKAFILRDLCARLPYGVKFKINETYLTEDMIKGGYDKTQELYGITREGNVELLNMDYHMPVESIKPYLFPLSSMTEEQKEEHKDLLDNQYSFDANGSIFTLQDFYNKYHFDIYGLIPMGLAIDATNKNIY